MLVTSVVDGAKASSLIVGTSIQLSFLLKVVCCTVEALVQPQSELTIEADVGRRARGRRGGDVTVNTTRSKHF